MRECTRALGLEKPLILVHEKDEEKGGAPLVTLRADCESNGCDAGPIFDDASKIITWYRLFEFQQLSLKLIAQRMLHATPLYDVPRPPKLYFRGDLKMESLELEVGVSLYTSRFNPGAADVAAQLEQSLQSSCLKLVRQPPQNMRHGQGRRKSSLFPTAGGRRSTLALAAAANVPRSIRLSFSSFVQQFSNNDVTHSERSVFEHHPPASPPLPHCLIFALCQCFSI